MPLSCLPIRVRSVERLRSRLCAQFERMLEDRDGCGQPWDDLGQGGQEQTGREDGDGCDAEAARRNVMQHHMGCQQWLASQWGDPTKYESKSLVSFSV